MQDTTQKLAHFHLHFAQSVSASPCSAAPPQCRLHSGALCLSPRSLCPESPRWLLAKERYADADGVLRRIAAVNGRSVPADFDVRCIIIVSHAPRRRRHAAGVTLEASRYRCHTAGITLESSHWSHHTGVMMPPASH